MRIGPLELASNLLLAPLAGWTTPAFRTLVREIGGVGMATTEVVAVRPLLARTRKTEEYLRRDPGDRPLAVQINPRSPGEAREAAKVLEERGFEAIDLNLGCPVRKIARSGAGAALARDGDSAAAVAAAAVAAVKVPVTAKMRLGWDAGDLTAPGLARALFDVGVAAVSVHGRTRAQGFSGDVDRSGIRAVVEANPGRVVIGNGDVRTAEDARRMIEETGCSGVLIGRAAVTNPWIFLEARALIERGERRPEPSIGERAAACERHLRLLARGVPEAFAARQFRKVLRAWGRALGAGERFWDDAARIDCIADVQRLLEGARAGEERVREQDWAVPVPAGPTDHW